jgi:hypothetical protein
VAATNRRSDGDLFTVKKQSRRQAGFSWAKKFQMTHAYDYIDVGMAGSVHYYLSPQKDINMRVPKSVRDCVVYIGLPDKDNPDNVTYGGTAFIVTVPGEYSGSFAYLVTAKHTLDAIGNRPYVVRANTKDGRSVIISGEGTEWTFHPDPTVDAAITRFGVPEEANLDWRSIPVADFLTDQHISDYRIGAGDEVVMTGLFTEVEGRHKNLPIVRMGNVALIPSEPIPFNNELIDAYLIEARSIGGLSGSPAFVSSTVLIPWPNKDPNDKTPHYCWVPGKAFFLGIVKGHWQVPAMRSLNEVEKVNMGISVVVPAKKIREILYLPEQVEMRREIEKEELQSKTKTSANDSGFDEAVEQTTFTRKDFEAALKKVSRKVEK